MTIVKRKIRITLTEEMLGTASGDKDVHGKFIASKSADKEKAKEELESLPAEELMKKSMTVFHRDENGNPMLYDYQVKGFFKEALGVKVEFAEHKFKVKRKEYKVSKWTCKKITDNYLFINPRKISLVMPEGKEITETVKGCSTGSCTRPLRADTMKGPRVALATSETVPAGTTFECEVVVLHPDLEEMFMECLDYGEYKGLGQWRSSGKGRFLWEEVQ